MAPPVLVLAASHRDAERWAQEEQLTRTQWLHLCTADQVRGYPSTTRVVQLADASVPEDLACALFARGLDVEEVPEW